jgi:antitoxin component HigA of HigAB toxin-antitoxin module
MSRIQYLMQDDKPVAVQIPIDLWERMRALAEEAEDLADLARFDREDDGVRIPLAVVQATALGGATPLRAWREHRGLTLQALADAAGLSKPYVSQIESGKRAGTAATLKKLASALGVPVAVLLP